MFINFIDTPSFQRLRNICQTSYQPLYPCSLHNRFVHSLGVYHLGKLAVQAIEKSLSENGSWNTLFIETEWERVKDLFLSACLLHDVGHAPFSHTGEYFYLDQLPSIRNILNDKVKSKSFTKSIEKHMKESKEAKPHEIMSCIVAIDVFSRYFKNAVDREFFSRCITGYCYNEKIDSKTQILNCFIKLLNSTIIDVDRLDYIIRDAYTTGYQSVQIDVERLLNGVCLSEQNGCINLAYDKSALSVIENVIYAHDAERKWIQQHPTILYESFIICHVMQQFEKKFAGAFAVKTLLPCGNKIGNKPNHRFVSLFSDEDIISFMKNDLIEDDIAMEYFNRNNRRKPIWKTEAEYRSLFEAKHGKEGAIMTKLESDFSKIEGYLTKTAFAPIINQELLKQLDERDAAAESDVDPETRNKIFESNIVKKWVLELQEIAKKNKIPFDFVIIRAKKFQSNFAEDDLPNTLIRFASTGQTEKITKVSPLLKADKRAENTPKEMFYIFYRQAKKGNKKVPIKITEFAKKLYDIAMKELC